MMALVVFSSDAICGPNSVDAVTMSFRRSSAEIGVLSLVMLVVAPDLGWGIGGGGRSPISVYGMCARSRLWSVSSPVVEYAFMEAWLGVG